MKNKGFTIVELLAVIIILATIVSLGVVSFQAVSKKVLKSNYESKKDLIELKATIYANDTGFLVTSVDNLVKNGYLDADDEEGNIINPETKEKMNCSIVFVHNDGKNLYGTMEEKNNSECLSEEEIKTNTNIELSVYKKSDYNNHLYEKVNDWVNEDIVLEITLKDTSIDLSKIKKIVWSTNTFTKEVDVNNNFSDVNTLEIDAIELMNTTYYVEVYLDDNIVYYTYQTIKIDKENPLVYSDSVKVTLDNAFVSRDNTLKVTFSDKLGSGISSYYIGENDNCEGAIYEDLTSDTISVPVLLAHKYYICVKDKVGNIGKGKEAIDLINFYPPTISVIDELKELDGEDYLFEENVIADFGIFNGIVSCDPTKSLKTGEYTVTCNAISENGLSSSTSFLVKHNSIPVIINEP